MSRNSTISLINGLFFISVATSMGQGFGVVHNFTQPGSPFPFGRMVQGEDTLYGINGGYVGGMPDFGSIFKVKTDGSGYAIIKTFSKTYPSAGGAYTNTDGSTPLGGLILDRPSGKLYGTTYQGGKSGLGVVFFVETSGSNFTALKHFTGVDGKNPYSEVVLDNDMLYGTTAAGGESNKGTIFRMKKDGSNFQILKSFHGEDGLLPLSGLTLSGGVLYGTTYRGGSPGQGTVFSIHTDGSVFSVLKVFTGADGANPRYNLILNGNSIYGVTEASTNLSQSLVYKLTTDGSDFTVLKTFSAPDANTGTNTEGFHARSSLAAAGDSLFGCTMEGGYYASGVVFAMRMDGSDYSVLKHFSQTDLDFATNYGGATPFPSLILSGGILYGTAQQGGSAGAGTLFSLNIAPVIQLGNQVDPDNFSFSVSGYSNQTIVIEAATEVPSSSWQPLQTNTIATGPIAFTDSNAGNFPRRFYRIRSE